MITACYGLGGVGKTQLVIEYLYRHFNDYRLIIWIPADNASQIKEAYLGLAHDLKLVAVGEKITVKEAVRRVQGYLTNQLSTLLIYDNVLKYDVLEKYLPLLGCDVLVTSRHTQWPGEAIEVDVFSLEDARLYVKKIIKKITKQDEEENNIDKLIIILGYLPLALAQACAYIHRNKKTIASYLALYEKRRLELLNSKLLSVGVRHEPVSVTWNITLEAMKNECS